MYEYLSAWVLSVPVFNVCGDEKRTLHILKLKLQVAMSYHVDAGNQSYILCKNSKGS